MNDPGGLTQRRIVVIMSAVFLTNILAALDQTIVGTALPKIAAQLNGYEIYAWVFAAYLLAATATVAVVGKFSDIFGRKKVVIVAVATFATGSVLCGLAWNMPALVAFRALQGIGGGGIATSALAIISDLFPPRDRAKWQTVLSLSYATSSAIGPVVGGLLTDNLSWRWIFFVNLPIAVAAMLALGFALPRFPSRGRPQIDWAGAGLTVIGVLSLLLALTWGGREFPWTSWQVIALLLAATGCGFLFPIVERRAKEAIIAPGLLRGPVTPFCCVVTFTQGFVWYGCILLAPLYLQGVAGLSATRAGGDLTPAVVLSGIAGISAGVIVARTGRYKPIVVLGGLATLTSSVWLALLGVGTAELQILIALVLLGVGIGWVISPTVVAVSNAVRPDQQGVAMGVLSLFRQMGATIGTTVLGIFVGGKAVQAAPATLAPAVHIGFIVLSAGGVLMLAMALATKDVPLRGRSPTVVVEPA